MGGIGGSGNGGNGAVYVSDGNNYPTRGRDGTGSGGGGESHGGMKHCHGGSGVAIFRFTTTTTTTVTTTFNPKVIVQKFSGDGPFTLDTAVEAEFLLVGGGGSGGSGSGGGGGGGAGGVVVTGSGHFDPGTYQIVVGTGGVCNACCYKRGDDGMETFNQFPGVNRSLLKAAEVETVTMVTLRSAARTRRSSWRAGGR